MSDPDGGVMTLVKPSCIGPLAIHIEAFAARLGGEGFTSKTVQDKCELVAKLSAWLHRRDLSQDALDKGDLDQFHTDRRRQGHVRRGEVATGQQLLRYLRDLGCVQALPPGPDPTPLDNLTRDFGRHLSSERGLSPATLGSFLSIAGLKPKGARQWKGACPFCKGLDCFVVSNDGGREKTGAFNCFKCPAGGDQIELVSLSRGHSRKDRQGTFAAAKELHERFLAVAGGVGNSSSNSSPQPNRESKERRTGFDPEAHAKSLDPAHEALTGLGIDQETLREWKAGFASSGVLRGRLALPIARKGGELTAYFGRAIKEESPMLTFPNGLDPRAHIFGADRVTNEPLSLVRDPLEVLKAFETGCGVAVCFLTEDVAPIQLEALAALMDERKCELLSFF